MERLVKKVIEIRLSAEELANIVRAHVICTEHVDVAALHPLVKINFEGYQNSATDQPQITAVNVVIETRI